MAIFPQRSVDRFPTGSVYETAVNKNYILRRHDALLIQLLLKEKRSYNSPLGKLAVAMMHNTRLQSSGLGTAA
jgi:hypothetical protein